MSDEYSIAQGLLEQWCANRGHPKHYRLADVMTGEEEPPECFCGARTYGGASAVPRPPEQARASTESLPPEQRIEALNQMMRVSEEHTRHWETLAGNLLEHIHSNEHVQPFGDCAKCRDLVESYGG